MHLLTQSDLDVYCQTSFQKVFKSAKLNRKKLFNSPSNSLRIQAKFQSSQEPDDQGLTLRFQATWPEKVFWQK